MTTLLRSTAYLLFGTLMATVVLNTAAAAERPEARPNVILLMADDQGWGDIETRMDGHSKHPVLKTPHLDAMGAAGLRFTRFYAGSPVCSPTRGSSLTGRHPERYGIVFANAGHMKREEVTLAEVARSQQFATGFFGKWHLGTLTKTVVEANRGGPRGVKHFSPPQEHGFDVCFATESKVPTWDPTIQGGGDKWWHPTTDADRQGRYGTHYWNERGEQVEKNLRGDDSRVIMDRAAAFVEDCHEQEQPFFMVVWFHAPHLPVVAGEKYTAMYPEASNYEKHFYGCITAMDEQVGRLRAKLRELGIEKETILFCTSDNGPEGRADKAPGVTPFRGRKRDVYEGGVRVPGIVEWPGHIEPGTTDFPASTLDYFPTVVELLGLELAEVLPNDRPIDGQSLLGVWQAGTKERARPIPFVLRHRQAWNDNRYKLVRYGRQPDELYDLLEDPLEKKNLAEEQPERVERMRAEFDAWRESAKRSAAGGDY